MSNETKTIFSIIEIAKFLPFKKRFRIRNVITLQDYFIPDEVSSCIWACAINLDTGLYQPLNAEIKRYTLLSTSDEICLFSTFKMDYATKLAGAGYGRI